MNGALDNDATRAFLFETADGTLLGVSLDSHGANLPRDEGQKWMMQTEFELGVHDPVPAAIDPEPILRREGRRIFRMARASDASIRAEAAAWV